MTLDHLVTLTNQSRSRAFLAATVRTHGTALRHALDAADSALVVRGAILSLRTQPPLLGASNGSHASRASPCSHPQTLGQGAYHCERRLHISLVTWPLSGGASDAEVALQDIRCPLPPPTLAQLQSFLHSARLPTYVARSICIEAGWRQRHTIALGR